MEIDPKFQRLALLTGIEGVKALSGARVLVFGLGGVGSWCAEALVRSGIGSIGIVDSDLICVTNINRQVQATSRTVGASKAGALAERLREINPRCGVTAFEEVFSRESSGSFGIPAADYVIDAIDSLSHNLALIETCGAAGVRFYSSMGTALKLDPTQLKTADIWKTQGCPLARLVRQGLRRRGFTGNFTVVYSPERLPLQGGAASSCGSAHCLCPARNRTGGSGEARPEWCGGKKVINGSAVTVTAAAGMILASLVIRDMMSHG
jgi:tRNA A37 threonylcarbamoyladenosine dehydratase